VWCDYHWPLDVLASWCLTLTLLSGVAAAQTVAARSAVRGETEVDAAV
jgi:undecaprenyl-diphosphatase